jgi:serine/threonine protein kinase
VCASGFEGTYCQYTISSSGVDVLAAVLGSIIPAAFILLLLLVLCLVINWFVLRRHRNRRDSDDWEIEFDELQLGDLLGQGGFGQVFKATWKGTEVAAKMVAMSSGDGALTRGAVESFKEEARVMSHLRHPNVVLFMAACTKPPRMCIVMEFMALGSLFDLLHNELIADIPMALKVKLVYQAAKGMQFLHSSGIVHRDLKSLNLLLDAKWNVKVSDFGLTRFKSSIKPRGQGGSNAGEVEGSVPWMAPEVLEDKSDVDHSLGDVYSFGIIMWEVLTRDQPYAGMMPAQIAVAVIRNDLRPYLDSDWATDHQSGYVDIMTKCWHRDTTVRHPPAPLSFFYI